MAVVVRRAEAAVDLRRREDEAAPPAERHDLVHRHRLGRLGHGAGRFDRLLARSTLRMSTSFVELHVISDSTGETAARLVLALEAQFPDTEFEVVRHPRVETSTTSSSRSRARRDRPAVIVYTLVDRELRETMRELCRRAKLHCCDLLGQPIEEVAARLRQGGEDGVAAAGRRSTRSTSSAWRRSSSRSSSTTGSARASGKRTSCSSASRGRRRRRSRCTSATSATRSRTSRSCAGSSRRSELFEIDRAKIVGLTIDAERLVGDPPGARAAHAAVEERLLRARRDLRGARAGGGGAPAARLPGRRRLASCRSRRRRSASCGSSSAARPRRSARREREAAGPVWRWALWWCAAGAGARPLLRPLHAGLARDPDRPARFAGPFAEEHRRG